MISSRWTWGLALLLATACAGGTMRPESAIRAHGTDGDDDPLARRTAQISDRMASVGWHPAEFGSSGFLPENAATTLAIEVPVGRCYTIVAIATRGVRDLDAILYAPSGDVLVEDVRPDPHPAVQICSGERPRRTYYHLQAYGAGAYRILAFEAGRDLLGSAEQALGIAPAAATGGELSFDTRSEQHEFAAGLRRRGFEPVGDSERVSVTEGHRLRVPLPVERGQCYTVGAFATADIGEISLRVVDEVGDDLVRSLRPSAAPAVQLCTANERTLTVEVAAEKGRGHVDLVVFRGRDAVVGGTGGLWLGRRSDARLSRVSLHERLPEEESRAKQFGYGTARRIGSGELVRAQAIAHRHTLEAGRCTLIRATGGEGVGRFLLRVVGTDGTSYVERDSRGPVATGRVCTTAPIPVEIHLVVRAGSGGYAIDASTKPLPRDLPREVGVEHAGRWLDAVEDEMEGWAVRDAQVIALPASVDVPDEGCHRMRVFALGGASTVEASLSRDEGRAVEGGRFTELVHCAGDSEGAARLEVSSRDGAPRAAVILLEKTTARRAAASP